MSFGLILLIGTVIFYLLALITLNIDSKNTTALQSLIDLLKNLGIIIGTALATIIAFYFGVRGSETAVEKAALAFTGGADEKKPPTIVNTDPVDGATGVKVDSLVQATFSETMNDETINKVTFTVKKQGETNPIKGKISPSPDNKTAMFDADEDFSPNTVYIATIDIAAQAMAGDKLVSGKNWSFTTESAPSHAHGGGSTPSHDHDDEDDDDDE